ncbi:hypothetical protein [Burkholderia sp. Ac-20344]|uniref:hypothetical protein n=1 Tax=Burkholderia sp. Ac-20344 TaxID=2703890 RepID=UPI00197C6B60|nr:hypothetical protein [Burkholderia sp. Ac-20344]MBN3832578.1 hypothetical protein [Burkholderia sp. Ac-20344]
MNSRNPGQEKPNKPLSREEILAAVDVKPVFEVVTHDAGTITVTSMRVHTLERIAVEFERDNSDDDTKLRCLLRELGRTNGEEGQSIPVSDSLVGRVTTVELADFARKLLVSEEWASEDEAALEPDPKRRVIEALQREFEAAGASYRKILDSLGPSISAATRASISNATRLADKLRMDIVTSSPSFKAIEALQRQESIARLAAMQGSIAGSEVVREHVLRLKDTLPSAATSDVSSRIQSLPPMVNPAVASAKATAESAAKMEQALERLEQRANDSALLITGIHDMIRDTTLDMARNAQESSAATKQSLDQAAASVAIGAQSLTWAKYALMASVVIGLVGLVFAAISAWYAVFPANTAQLPSTVAEGGLAPRSMQPTSADRFGKTQAESTIHGN